MLLNVLDYVSPAAALLGAQSGDRVYFPGPGPYIAPTGGWRITKPLEVFGDWLGLGTDDTGSVLKPASAADHVFVVVPPLAQVHFHDLRIKLDAQPGADSTGNGIHCLATTNNKITEIRLERVVVTNLGNDAFHFEGLDTGTSAIVFVHLQDCQAVACRGSGLFFKNCTAGYVTGGYMNGNRKFGAYCEASPVCFLDTAFENNQQGTGANDFDVQLRLKLCHGFSVTSCDFEQFSNNATLKTAISVENCIGGLINAMQTFNTNGAGTQGSRGVFISGGSKGIVVGPSKWGYTDILVDIKGADNNTNCIVLPQSIANSDVTNSRCFINMPDADGNGNYAFLPTGLTTGIGAGLLLPRVASPTGIVSTNQSGTLNRGLVVYNSTTNKLNFWDGTAWRVVTST